MLYNAWICSRHYLGEEDAWKGVLMEKIDKGTDKVKKLQEELNRRTAEEQRAADLMTEGRNEEGDAVLAGLDDDVI